jgi:hypothetical protein
MPIFRQISFGPSALRILRSMLQLPTPPFLDNGPPPVIFSTMSLFGASGADECRLSIRFCRIARLVSILPSGKRIIPSLWKPLL